MTFSSTDWVLLEKIPCAASVTENNTGAIVRMVFLIERILNKVQTFPPLRNRKFTWLNNALWINCTIKVYIVPLYTIVL